MTNIECYGWYLKMCNGAYLVPSILKNVKDLSFVLYCEQLRSEQSKFINGSSIQCDSEGCTTILSISSPELFSLIEYYNEYHREIGLNDLKSKKECLL
jgi:hypothetical protein